MLSEKEVLAQSKAAFAVWEKTWRGHAEKNGKMWKEKGCPSHRELLGSGKGKNALCVAMGPSLEDHIELIKQYKDNVEIICVDKAFGYLIEHGIQPAFVFLADAGIDYDRWVKPYIGKSKDSTLVMNMGANPVWAENWKGPIYWYINKDNIQSEKMFMDITGYNEVIPAGSNVGNSVIIFALQVLGYDAYILTGYDFCWSPDGNYYAFNDSDKRYYMKGGTAIDANGNLVYSSPNLVFSSRWLSDFSAKYMPGIDLFNCSTYNMMNRRGFDLERLLKISTKRELTAEERIQITRAKAKKIRLTEQDGHKLGEILQTHKVYGLEIDCIEKEMIA